MCVGNRARSNLTQYCACKIYKLEIQRGDSRDVVGATRIYASMYKSIDKRESTGAISIHGPVSVAFSTFNLVATIYHPEITLLLLFVTTRSTESPRFAPRILFFVNHVSPILRADSIRSSANRPISLYIQLRLRPKVCTLSVVKFAKFITVSRNLFDQIILEQIVSQKSRLTRIY